MYFIVDTDKNFVKPLAVTFYSITKHAHSDEKNVFFLIQYNDKKLPNEDIVFLKKYIRKQDKIECIVVPHHIDGSITGKWSDQVLLKIIGLYYLPDYVDRIFHIDGDAIVVDDITEFYYSEKLLTYTLLGTKEVLDIQKERNQLYGLKDDLYLCAGVIMINVKLFLKKFPTIESFNDEIKNVKYEIRASDQDFLNTFFDGEKTCWETDQYMRFALLYLIHDKSYLSKKISIIHYAGIAKPWKPDRRLHYRIKYWKYGIRIFGIFYYIKYLFKRLIWFIKYCFNKVFGKNK